MPRRNRNQADNASGRKLSLRDVAEQANVSLKTASLALNKRPGVEPETQAKVRQAAAELGYALPSQRRKHINRIIGVCVPDLLSDNDAELAHYIIQYASKKGFATILEVTEGNDVDVRRIIDVFRRLSVDAVALTSTRIAKSILDSLEALDIVIVPIIGWPPQIEVSSENKELPSEISKLYRNAIFIDHYTSNYLATKYLLRHTFNRYVYISGPSHSVNNKYKQKGFEDALNDEEKLNNSRTDDNKIIFSRKILEPKDLRYSFDSGFRTCEVLIQLPEDRKIRTAIVCYNDEQALGVLACLKKYNISVPGQFAVIGNDDIRWAESSKLTTNQISREKIALRIIETIMGQLYQEDDYHVEWQRNIMIPDLILRDSTPIIENAQ